MIQIFGTKKCQDSRKAERFFRERSVPIQVIDLGKKGPSPGELASIAARVGGLSKLIDRAGKRFAQKGLAVSYLTDPDIQRLLLEDPMLMRTPVVRNGPAATLGYAPEIWSTWL
jgi:arsenate reductase-like glutaredoxin family protein